MSIGRLPFDAGASAYDRLMGRWARLDIPALLAAARITAGNQVLDAATGTGEVALMAASLVGPSGRVLGFDISLPMLRVAMSKAAGTRVRFVGMDAEALALKSHVFDAVVCRLGLMFFPDLARGLEEFRRVLRPGGRLVATVLPTPDRAPLIGIVAVILGPHAPAYQNDLRLGYSLSDPLMVEQALARAGFGGVRVTRDMREIVFDSFDDYWAPFEAGAGRLGQIYRSLPDEARRAVVEKVRACTRPFETNGRLAMKMESLVAFGTA